VRAGCAATGFRTACERLSDRIASVIPHGTAALSATRVIVIATLVVAIFGTLAITSSAVIIHPAILAAGAAHISAALTPKRRVIIEITLARVR
jgi:hypothetical protein